MNRERIMTEAKEEKKDLTSNDLMNQILDQFKGLPGGTTLEISCELAAHLIAYALYILNMTEEHEMHLIREISLDAFNKKKEAEKASGRPKIIIQ
jgi:hypothetical protein